MSPPSLANGYGRDFDERLRAVEVDHAVLREGVEGLRRSVAEGFASLDDKFDKLEGVLKETAASQHDRDEKLRERTEQIEARLVPVEQSVALAKAVGSAGLRRLWPMLVAAVTGLVGGSLLDALKLLGH